MVDVKLFLGSGGATGTKPIGVGGFTRYGSQQWDTTQDQLIAGQQTALGLSIQGVSGEQMQRLKTRMEATKATLEQAQKAPESQREQILKAITGEQLTGDLLTASIWGYFAALQSHGQIAASQAKMIDLPALSYGLFHAQVAPNKIYGIVTTGVVMEGLNFDIGHMRHIRWTQDDNPESAINNKPELTTGGRTAAHNRWIAYNKMRGQYESAMEHAMPEQFWVDRNKCSYLDDKGNIKNPSLPQCAEAISAVKAIAIAQSQGQKIYTVNKDNAATALPKLTLSGTVGTEIRSAIEAGKEVTFHEKAISAHGWSGQGYIIVDPETGAGAYIIEGKGNGGFLSDTFAAILGFLALVIGSFGLLGIKIALVIGLLIFIDGLLDLLAIESCSSFPSVLFWSVYMMFTMLVSGAGIIFSTAAATVFLFHVGAILFILGLLYTANLANSRKLSCIFKGHYDETRNFVF